MSTRAGPGLRERKKSRTRRAIQEHALRLFLAKGYDATTVAEIAAAAEVSPMTFFRYFPSKEDAVMADEYDPLIGELIAARPADEPAVEKVRRALAEGFRRVIAADRDAILVRTRLILETPQLRARLWEQQLATEQLIVEALAGNEGGGERLWHLRVVAAVCLGAVTAAVLEWAGRDGRPELPALVAEALSALRPDFGDNSE